MINYIFRNIRRSWVKSCITIAVSAGLFIALGQFVVLWQNTYTMRENTPVVISFFEITTSEANLLENIGLVKNPYFSFQGEVFFDIVPPFWVNPPVFPIGLPRNFIVTNDIERFTDMSIHVEFEYGFDLERFMVGGGLYVIICYSTFRGGTEERPAPSSEFGDHVQLMRFVAAAQHTRYFRLVGYFRVLDDGFYPLHNYVFVPPGVSHSIMYPDIPIFSVRGSIYDFAEFTVVNNREIELLRDRLDRMGIMEYQYIMDTKVIDRISNNLYIYEMIFPLIAGVLALISGLMPLLMILQSTKEAALLRALGTAKSRTRLMIAGQYIITCITGLIIGIIAVLAYNETQIIFDIINLFILFAALLALFALVGSIIGVIKITYLQVLALLQVRE